MILTGYIERMGEMRNSYTILVGNLSERDHSEDKSVDGKLILQYILRK
jgi:hypothetical protein